LARTPSLSLFAETHAQEVFLLGQILIPPCLGLLLEVPQLLAVMRLRMAIRLPLPTLLLPLEAAPMSAAHPTPLRLAQVQSSFRLAALLLALLLLGMAQLFRVATLMPLVTLQQ
jgi:hypothetical protein